MKKYLYILAPLLPLAVVAALTISDVSMDAWVYLILSVICPVAAGITWYVYFIEGNDKMTKGPLKQWK